MKRFTLFSCLLFVALIGCANEKGDAEVGATLSEDTAEAAVRKIMEGVKNGQPVVAWHALPESYQSDVNELVQTFGKNMDAQTWQQVTGLLSSIHSVLDTKQEFIFNHPGIAGGQNPESAKQGIVHVTGLLKTILDSAGSLDKLKTFDGTKFMETTGATVAEQLSALKAIIPENSGAPVALMSFGDVQVETVEATDSTATLKFVKANGEAEETPFVKVQGKWLPKDMVDDWDQNMTESRQALAELPKKAAGMRMQVMGVGGMIGGMLTPLQSAETQEQFNTSVDNLVAGAGMFLGPLMGGGGPAMIEPPAPPESLGDSFGQDAERKDKPLQPTGK